MLQDNETAVTKDEDPQTAHTLSALPALDISAARAAMDQATDKWHTHPAVISPSDHVLGLHHANFELWHLEDEARDPRASAQHIAAVKRSIDQVNQARNNTAEAIDEALMLYLSARQLPHANAPLHSETPGQMLDRLSILSLKQFHTAQECTRTGASEAHRERNRQRLAILQTQSADLADCLHQLWSDVLHGQRRFKLYRQFKMYNDADLNPVLYRDPSTT